MNKNTIKLAIVILAAVVALIILFIGLKNIKIDEFHPAAVIFVIDSSASNQQKLDEQKEFVSQACKRLDPEDHVKIIRVSEDAYLIYEGSALSSRNIRKSMEAFTQYDETEWGTAYGTGVNKAIAFAKSMYKEGYTPAIVVVGDLENEGKKDKQIESVFYERLYILFVVYNYLYCLLWSSLLLYWDDFPSQVKQIKTDVPKFAMMFVYAHPQKLDMVKTKLNPILGESNLVISTEENLDKSLNRFLKAIER